MTVRFQSISPILAALGAAVFFGGSTPFAKQLVVQVSPVLLAGLLYAGSGIGLILTRLIKDHGWRTSGLAKGDVKEPHTHHHIHEIIQHSHVHYPDIHHRHDHPNKPCKEKPRQD